MKHINIILSFLITLFCLQNGVAQLDTVKIKLSQVSGSPGEVVCIDVSFENFKDIQSAQFTLKYNSAKLDYVSASKGALNGFDPTININGSKPGEIKFAYIDAISGQTVPNNVTAFSLCFLIKGNANDFDCLTFDEAGTVYTEFSDINGNSLPFKYNTASCNKINFVPVSLKPVRLTIDKGKAKVGDTVCLPIRVFDYNKIKTFNYDLTWDVTKLKFEYLTAVDTRFAPNGTATPFYTGTPAAGKMTINWTSALINATNLTLPDSTVIFTMCFKVTGNEGDVTCLRVASTPTPNVITTTSNNQNVGLNSTDGCVRIPAKIEPVKMSFCDPNQTRMVTTGQEFCIDVKVSDFDTIGGMKATLCWDSTWFSFVKYDNLMPPDGVNNVAWTFNVDKANGFLAFIFESQAYSTLPANTVLFRVCLKARGLVGKTQGLKLCQIPVAPEAWSKTSFGDDIGITVTNDDCPIMVTSAIKITDTLIVQPNCKNPLGGKINMTVDGGTPPYNFIWSPNAYNSTTKDVKDLPIGNFYCTITDSNTPTPNILIAFFDIAGDLTKPTAKAKATGQLTCNSNSFVTLDGAGSSTGNFYTYKWISTNGVISGADNALTAKAISGTTYALQVTDSRNGCIDSAKVAIAPAPGAPNADAGPEVPLPCNLLGAPVPLNGCKSTQAGTTFAWSSPNGGQIVNKFTACDPLVRGAGTYILTVTLTATGCAAYSQTNVIGDSNTPISIAFVGDSLNCLNNTVTLDGSKSTNGVGVSSEWISLESNPIVNPTNIKATVDKPGNYILKIRNALGCIAADTIVVYDFRTDTVSAFAKSPVRLSCDGSVTKLDGTQSSKGADIFYKWTIAPASSGKITADANTTTPTIEQVGKYILTVTNRKSYCEAIASVTVLQANAPQGVDAGKDTVLTCFTNEIQLDAAAPAGADFDLKWTTKTGSIKSGAASLSPIITKAGVYYFTVTEKSTKCATIDSLLITENKDKPNAKIIGEKELTCGKDTIVLNAQGSQGADIFEWFTKDGNIAGSTTLSTATITKAGTYILLASKVSNGCVDSATHVVKFTYPAKGNAGKDTVLCSSNSFTLSATLSGNVTGVWTSLDGAKVSDVNNNIVTVDSLKKGRNRFAWVLSAAGCLNFSKDTVEIFVENAPNLKDDIFSQRNNGQFLNVPVTLNDDLKGVKSWKIELLTKPTYGTLELTASKGSLRYKPGACFAGVQEFLYKICSDFCPNACDTAKVKLNILEDPSACDSIVIANVITPNADGKNDVFQIDAIEFQPDRFKNAELIVFNRWGDVVYKSGIPYANNWGGTDKNGNELPEATYYYILDLNLPDGRSYRGDITILR